MVRKKPSEEEKKKRKAEYSKLYRKNNPEKIKEIQKKYSQNNFEKLKAKQKEYYQNNTEKVKKAARIKSKKYYYNNREEALEKSKLYKKNNPEKVKKFVAAYRKNNHEKILAAMKKYNDRLIHNLPDVYIKRVVTRENIVANSSTVLIKKTLLLFGRIIRNKINKIKAKEIMVTIQANLKKESKQLQKLIKMMLISMEQYIDGDITLSQAKTVASMGNTTYKAIAGKVTLDQALLNQ